MAKPAKEAVVARIRELLPDSKATIVADHTGLDVDEISGLRNELRQEGAEFHVVKNTLARIAARETGQDKLVPYLQGPTAIAFVQGDPVQTAKLLVKFIREHRKLVLKGGLLGGKDLSADDIRAVASLPSREALLAQLAGTMQMPVAGLAGAMSALIRSFAYGLQALQKQKGEA